jgi:glycerol-3-phosphate dehydrogenase
MVVNAGGPWAAEICSLGDIKLDLDLSRGTMFATAGRLTNAIINRLRPPSDGDILVSIGNVSIFGTTDVPVQNPSELGIQAWEIDLLFEQGRALIPDLSARRMLRAWSGIRSNLPSKAGSRTDGRETPRSHQIVDHEQEHGLAGMLTITGGKWTTFRLIAEQVVDRVCEKAGVMADSRSAHTPLLLPDFKPKVKVSDRVIDQVNEMKTQNLICECEYLTEDMVDYTLNRHKVGDLDGLRKRLKLGHGPCQAAYCGYRSLSRLASEGTNLTDQYLSFHQARWRGQRPVAWGSALCQMEFSRRTLLNLIGFEASSR